MQTNQLKRIHPNKKRMVVARGGKRGKTAGRGGKGQSARAGNKRRPEWRDIIKRLPKLRGRGKNSNKPFQERPSIVNLSTLESFFSSNDVVTPTTLVEKGVLSTISGKIPEVKILGDGEITKSINVSGCYLSGSAVEKINKAGGSVVSITEKNTESKISETKKDEVSPKVEQKEKNKTSVKKDSKGDDKKRAKKVENKK